MPLGKPIKQGFLTQDRSKHKFLQGTIKQYGNKEGVAQKAIRR